MNKVFMPVGTAITVAVGEYKGLTGKVVKNPLITSNKQEKENRLVLLSDNRLVFIYNCCLS